MDIDLGKLTDGQLRELEKMLEAEKDSRKNGQLYKYQLRIGNDRYNKEERLLNSYVKKQGWDFGVREVSNNPIIKIQTNVFGIADYILGNFKARKRIDGTFMLTLNGSLVHVEYNDDYAEMYKELYSVIDKWTDKKFKDEGLEKEIEIEKSV